ncbi:unnamed protein product [Aureobasidium uvarum]|uniref:Uncharacterized protein n=1 Tax=Aureobasidium uvarum TaxID=2773716 RepID=A0A9N8PXG3_9PEZI|nr:unnamed protein product [Aureobasidium uvarum]
MDEPVPGLPLAPASGNHNTNIPETNTTPTQILPRPSPQANVTFASLMANLNTHSQPDITQPPSKRVRLEEPNTDAAVQDEPLTPSLHDSPGDPTRPESFFDCQAERKLAGYLGFISTSELHICAISWPLLRATVAIHPILHKLNKELALALIRDAERIGEAAAIDKGWSLLTSDGKGISNAKKAEHLTIVLINLKSDLATMSAASDKQNQLQHQHDCQKFNAQYPTHNCPQISYPVRPPILSPLAGEDFLEGYNRCFLLLRHMRNILKTNVFDTRYKNDGFKSGHPINDEHKPAWMRLAGPSIVTTTTRRASHTATTQNADLTTPRHLAAPFSYSAISSIETKPQYILTTRLSLPTDTIHPDKAATNIACTSKSVAVIWDHDLEPSSTKPGLKRAMTRAQEKGVDPPSELQKLRKDPRQMDREPLLYEQIRIQFRCQFLGIDLCKLLLQYTTSAFGDTVTVKQNLQDESWADTQAALADPDNRGFVFRVGFFCCGGLEWCEVRCSGGGLWEGGKGWLTRKRSK